MMESGAPQPVREMLALLREADIRSYLVGGCVTCCAARSRTTRHDEAMRGPEEVMTIFGADAHRPG